MPGRIDTTTLAALRRTTHAPAERPGAALGVCSGNVACTRRARRPAPPALGIPLISGASVPARRAKGLADPLPGRALEVRAAVAGLAPGRAERRDRHNRHDRIGPVAEIDGEAP